MKNKALILLIILLSGTAIVLFLLRHQYSPLRAKIGSAAPDIELVGINKDKIKLSDMKGSIVFINFWATWCESCVGEMPSIETLFRQMSGNNKFKMVTILFKDDGYKALSYMKTNGYTFPVYLNPDDTAPKKFGITGVPETFIIDKKGVLRGKVIGPEEWDSPQAIESLQALIDEK